jgi:hypothetical protein
LPRTNLIDQRQAFVGILNLPSLSSRWYSLSFRTIKLTLTGQIFGKLVVDDDPPWQGKVRIVAYLLVIWVVGLGGLEPQTSP